MEHEDNTAAVMEEGHGALIKARSMKLRADARARRILEAQERKDREERLARGDVSLYDNKDAKNLGLTPHPPSDRPSVRHQRGNLVNRDEHQKFVGYVLHVFFYATNSLILTLINLPITPMQISAHLVKT